MRTVLRARLDIEASNKAIADGSLPKMFDDLFNQLKPEATYFATEHGHRTMYVFFDLPDASMIPQIAEPLFMKLKAEVTFTPVMNRQDLMKGLSQIKSMQKSAA